MASRWLSKAVSKVTRRHAGARRARSRDRPTASSWCSSARPAAGRRRLCAWPPGSRRSPTASCASAWGGQRPLAEEPRHRHGLPELRALPAPHGLRQHRVPARRSGRCRRPRSDAASTRRPHPRPAVSPERKPRTLSGGQRQRVAMGRAIVRQPAVFLMDEPLSNLDAKLRVQMRADIKRIQSNLGVTTIYVTHDQVEAMTMGDRVAVMRKRRAATGRPPRSSITAR